jgi:hypothetical protein
MKGQHCPAAAVAVKFKCRWYELSNGEDDFSFFDAPSGVSQCLHEVFPLDIWIVREQPSWPTIMLTETRVPRMQALPPPMPGVWIMRSNDPMNSVRLTAGPSVAPAGP